MTDVADPLRSSDRNGAEPGQWLPEAEQGAWRIFFDGTQRLIAALNQSLVDRASVSLPDYRVLVLLSEAPNAQLRMSALADGVASSRSRVTRQVAKLEAAGLVKRGTSATDLRGVVCELTEAGWQLLKQCAPVHVSDVREHLVDVLSEGELLVLGEIFSKVDAKLAGRMK